MACRITPLFYIILFFSLSSHAQERGNILLPYKKAENSPLVGDSGKRKAALVVGISDYSSKALRLKYAQKDAALVFDYLSEARQFPKENIFMLPDSLATSGRIYNSIHNLMKWLVAGDELVIYFAGHGDVQTVADFDEAFFLAWDASDSRNYYGAAGTLKLSDLDNYTNRLAGVKKVKVSLIMDACHAGFDLRKDGVLKAQENISSSFSQINKMLGCAVNEFSYEADSIGHGLFSWYLVQGLMGLADAPADNKVTFDELKTWTQKRVAAASKGKQNPVITSQNGEDIFAEITPAMRAAALDLQKNKTYSNLLAGRGRALEEDTIIAAKLQWYIDRYNYFLLNNQLYTGDSSCLSVIRSLSKINNTAADEIKAGLQNHLAEALETRSQLVLNEYLKGKSELPPAHTYFTAGIEASMADSLLPAGDPRKKNDQVMANFHKAFGYIRYENFEKYNEAESLLREALAKEDRASYLYVTMSYLMRYQNKYDSAIYYAEKAASIIPTWNVPQNILGNLYQDIYQWNKAIEYHKAVLKQDSNYVWSYNNIGTALVEMDRIKEAETYFLRSLQMKKNSGRERLDRDWAIAYSNLGVIYQQRGLDALAEKYYLIADSIDNSFALASRKLSALYASIDGERAELLLRKAMLASPFDAANYYELAELYRQYPLNNQSLQLADSFYKKAIQLNPYDEWYYAGLGYLCHSKEQEDAAYYWFTKGLNVSRNSADALYCIADYFTLIHQQDSALHFFKKAVARNPFDMMIAVEYSNLLLELKDTATAIGQMEKSIDLQSQSPKAFYLLGNFFYKIQQPLKAIAAYKKSVQVDSVYTNAIKALAYTELQHGNAKTSRHYIAQVLEMDNTSILVDYSNAVAEKFYSIASSQRNAWLSSFISIDPNNELWNELLAESAYASNADLRKSFTQLKSAEDNLSYNSPVLIKWLLLLSIEIKDTKLMKELAERYLDEVLNTEPVIHAIAMKLTGNEIEAGKIKKEIKAADIIKFRVNFKRLFLAI